MSPQQVPRASSYIPQPFSPLAGGSGAAKPGIPRPSNLGPNPQLRAPGVLYPGSPNPYSSPRPLVAGPSAAKRPREESVSVPKKEGKNAPATEITASSSTGPTSSKDAVAIESLKPPPSKRQRTKKSPADAAPKASITSPTPPTAETDTSLSTIVGLADAETTNGSRNRTAKPRSIMSAISHEDDAASIVALLLSAGSADVDVVLDNKGHTSLHFAASLSRLPLVEALVLAGADVYRGNRMGETPLMRCVLSQSCYTAQLFPEVLKVLAASVPTKDSQSRSILHHIALVASVKSHAHAAEYYLENVLEYIARSEGGGEALKSLVEIRDVHGDTALNIAARVGNRSIVRNLVDVGASRDTANNLGLRPRDFEVGDKVSSSFPPRTYLYLMRIFAERSGCRASGSKVGYVGGHTRNRRGYCWSVELVILA